MNNNYHLDVSRSNRKSNIELLRIFSMWMILSFHYAYHGIEKAIYSDGYIEYLSGSTANKAWTCFLHSGGEIGVGVFFMITGYFMISKKTPPALLKIILECLFYVLVWVIIYFLLRNLGISVPYLNDQDILIRMRKCIFNPASGGDWWFVSAYIVLALLSPAINALLNRLNNTGFILFIICDWFLWYVVPSYSGGPFIYIEKAIFYYALGAGCNRFFLNKKKKYADILFAILIYILITVLTYLRLENISDNALYFKALSFMIEFMFVPLDALFLFLFFTKINVKQSIFINTISATTLGIYLMSDSIYTRPLIWIKMLNVSNHQYKSIFYPLLSIITILLVFEVCSVIDFMRIKLFESKAIEIIIKSIKHFEK